LNKLYPNDFIIIREIVIIIMRKKYEKVDLKSDAFKIKKTP